MRSIFFKNSILCAIIMLSFVSNLWASDVLTWNDCVKESIAKHPDLISAAAKLEGINADKGIARSGALPQVSTNLTAAKSQSASQDATEKYSYSITGKQLLFDGLKTSNAIKEAQENINAGEYAYMVTSSNIRLNLKTVFAELLRAQELVSLTQSIANRREQNRKLINLRYEAGREHKGSLLTAEADLASAEFEVEQALRNISLTQTKMAKALGRQEISEIVVSGDFNVEQEDRQKPDFEMLANETPFLQELIAKKDAAQFNLGSTESDFFPAVYLNSSLGQSSSEWAPDEDEWMLGLTVSFPIFEGGNRIAQVAKAKAGKAQAIADEQSGRDSVIVTLEETWSNYQDSLGIVLVQKKFLEAAEERAKIANEQYSSGLISFDDWIIIEDSLVSSKKSYLNAQANVLIAEAGWIQAKGGILEYENQI